MKRDVASSILVNHPRYSEMAKLVRHLPLKQEMCWFEANSQNKKIFESSQVVRLELLGLRIARSNRASQTGINDRKYCTQLMCGGNVMWQT